MRHPRSCFCTARRAFSCGAFLTGLSLLAALPAPALVYHVGGFDTPGCSGTLDEVVAAAQTNPGVDVIQLESDLQFDYSVVIDGAISTDRLIFSGGWQGCSDVQDGDLSAIGGGSPGTTLWIRNGADVLLRRMEISGPDTLCLDVDGGSKLTLESSLVSFCLTGVRLNNGSELTMDGGSRIQYGINDLAHYGGGITCGTESGAGNGGTLRIAGRIQSNAAPKGGGIRAANGCQVILQNTARIEFNEATEGGGLYLESGADLTALLEAPLQIVIGGNDAGSGGGLYLTGPGTTSTATNLTLFSNRASFRGAGATVRDGALLKFERANFVRCLTEPRCAGFTANELTGTGVLGSAVFVDTGGRADIFQAYMEINKGPAFTASRVIHVEGSTSSVRLEGIQFWGNEAQYLVGANHSAVVHAGFVAAARNRWQFGDSSYLDSVASEASNGATVFWYSSILTDTRGFSGDAWGDCLIVDDDSGLGPRFQVLVGADPRFANAEMADLHLLPGSPAIDYCDSAAFPPVDVDFDIDVRGFDHPDVANNLGPFDLGVDEFTGVVSGPIFSDGFESGNTTAWSATNP